MRLHPGKLPPEMLREWLARIPADDPAVVVGAQYGGDAAAIQLGETCLVAKTDPITFTADRLGWYALNINANDVACMGARPRWFLATLLLPAREADSDAATAIFDDLLSACKALGVTLCGGHTEVTRAVTQPVLVGQMLGTTIGEKPLDPSTARAGDKVLLTKGIAIEGTAILAREKSAECAEALGDDGLHRAQRFLDAPGISVLAEALAVTPIEGVRGMHDPTEGGLAAGLAEVAAAADCGMRVEKRAIAVYPETKAVCERFGIDPMGLIASGALLIVASPESVEDIGNALRTPVAVIGELTERKELLLVSGSGEAPLTQSSRDELTKVL